MDHDGNMSTGEGKELEIYDGAAVRLIYRDDLMNGASTWEVRATCVRSVVE